MINVLVACEFSGIVRDAFRARGFYAMSCDLLPTEKDGPHFQGDVRKLLSTNWDLIISHPPCTYLSASGLHWNKRNPLRQKQTEEALDFVRLLMSAPCKHSALENPIGCISSQIRKPDQIIQPYDFGEDASKATCLWLKNLPKLTRTKYIPGRLIEYGGKQYYRWGNQTNSGQNKLGPSQDRWKLRSETYKGIAEAMATQWGDYILATQ